MEKLSLLFFLFFLIAIQGCSDDGDLEGNKKYKSFGNWPEYAGTWKSGKALVGSKWTNAVYLSVTINEINNK